MNANLPTLRLFTDQPLMQGTTIQLVGEAAHYLANVMRRRIGDKIELFNGLDNSFIADIIEVNKKRVTAMLISVARQRVLPPDIWLLFAPIKRTRLDFMAQKATELGASFAPLIVKTRFCAAGVFVPSLTLTENVSVSELLPPRA